MSQRIFKVPTQATPFQECNVLCHRDTVSWSITRLTCVRSCRGPSCDRGKFRESRPGIKSISFCNSCVRRNRFRDYAGSVSCGSWESLRNSRSLCHWIRMRVGPFDRWAGHKGRLIPRRRLCCLVGCDVGTLGSCIVWRCGLRDDTGDKP